MDSISVVIIAKDEEMNIGRCIESVIAALSNVENGEILLVDSASKDNTIEIAQNYPIEIIQISQGSFVSPSAGRYIGFLKSKGKYVVFLDGDMTLEKNWIENAIPIIDRNQKVAGIAGKCEEVFLDDNFNVIGDREDRFGVGNHISNVNELGGSALYRASVLHEIGGFNPYLSNEEELELGFRIRETGWELLRIPYKMTTHYTRYDKTTHYTSDDLDDTDSRASLKNIKRDLMTNRYTGYGQVLRLLLTNKMLFHYLVYLKRPIAFIVLCLLGLISSAIYIVFHDTVALKIWLVFIVSLFLLRCLLKKSLSNTVVFTIVLLFSSFGLIKGFFIHPMDPKTYTPKTTILKGHGFVDDRMSV